MDLASFRELESFAQFGSDLDAATQAKLARGRRTVEILKQPLHKPMPVQQQVIVLYALTRGYIDDVAISDIQRFQDELIAYVDANANDLFKTILETKNLPEDAAMNSAIEAFKAGFAGSTAE